MLPLMVIMYDSSAMLTNQYARRYIRPVSFAPSSSSPSPYVGSGFSGRPIKSGGSFFASSSRPLSESVTGRSGQSISTKFDILTNSRESEYFPGTTTLINPEPSTSGTSKFDISRQKSSLSSIPEESPPLSTGFAPNSSTADYLAAPETLDSSLPAGVEAAEAATMVGGEVESAIDEIPDPAPLISAGAILAQGIGDAKASNIASDGTVSSRMQASNLTRTVNNASSDTIAGASIGSLLGPLGSILGATISGLIGGLTTQDNTLNAANGQSIDPSDPSVKMF